VIAGFCRYQDFKHHTHGFKASFVFELYAPAGHQSLPPLILLRQRPEIDHQLELAWLFKRNVAGLCPMKDLSTMSALAGTDMH
jgi:hypothetical protein